MSKTSIGDHFQAEVTEGQEVDAVSKSHATRKVSENSSDGLENLRSAYQEFWAETHPSTPDNAQIESLTVKVEPEVEPQNESPEVPEDRGAESKRSSLKPRRKARAARRKTRAKVRKSARPAPQRFGLPEGFVPRIQRFGRGVLLELNIYRLPNGQEFIPCHPSGALGSRHLYALVTSEQSMSGKRGSVYVRGDGRIFDYSVASANSLGDMFDTGYTIYDLERTGRYAASPEEPAGRQKKQHAVNTKGKNKSKQARHRLAAAAR